MILGLELKPSSFPTLHSCVRYRSGCAMPKRTKTAINPSSSRIINIHIALVDFHDR